MIFLELFLTFFKIGLFTFGGGYAMLPLIQQAVLEKKWLDISSLMDFIAVSESTPGPFAVNISTYIGSERGVIEFGNVFMGILGSASATLGTILPSFIVILVVAHFYEQFKANKMVKGCMSGLKPAVIGLISSAALTMIGTVFFYKGINFEAFKTVEFYISAGIFAISTYFAIYKKAHPIILITAAAVIGIISGYALNL